MLCRLRYLRRLATPGSLLASGSRSIPTTPSVMPCCCSPGGRARSPLPLLLRQRPDKPSHRAFCTRAATAGEGAGSDSIFSPYSSVRVRCRKDDAVEVSEALLCFGASSASMDELNSCKDVNEMCITLIFADDHDVDACIVHAANSIGLSYTPSYEISMGDHCNWVMKMQEAFRPIEVTSDLWIVPKWSTPPDLQATSITLDPGMAFGTGEHPTTKLCLLLLRGLIKGGEHILDYGTGSGVLGIAAVKMGAALSIGIDIDPEAVSSARRNIDLNNMDSNSMLVYQVPQKFHSSCSSARTRMSPEDQTLYNMELHAKKGSFDIVIANILLNPLLELADDIVAYGKPRAFIGVSGILTEQTSQIIEHYSKHLEHLTVSEIDGWACVSGTKKSM